MFDQPKPLHEDDSEKTAYPADEYPFDSHPPSGPQHQYGKGGVGRTQRRLTARHVTFIGFGGGIGTGLFIGTGSALASAGPAGLLLAYVVVGAILWCVMECLGEMATYVSPMSLLRLLGRRPVAVRTVVAYLSRIKGLADALRLDRLHSGDLLRPWTGDRIADPPHL